ncbi:hypothetical protein EDD22DRAFT_963688 [Suillus occidentalis]|nr:hypothetical protein EDD22DRAFT_963688 [Suillus occidentalis]
MAPNDASQPTAIAPATRGARLCTTAKALFAPSKSIEEHLNGIGTRTDIITLTSARKQLSTNGMAISTAGGTIKHIIGAIFKLSLTPTLGATHSESLRAIAIILNEIEQTIDTNNIIDKLSALLGGPVATLDEKVDTLANLAESHATALEKTVTEVSKQLAESIVDIGKVAEKTSQTHTHTHQQNEISNGGSEGPRSYAAVTKTGIPAQLTKLLSCSEAQSRQILIDRRSYQEANDLKDLTEALSSLRT